MAKVPTFDYPGVTIDEAIRCSTILVEKLHGETNNVEAYAPLIGHKTAKSGTFLVKLGDIRKYGLLEPRGNIKATPLARTLAHPINAEERQVALNQMIMKVDLWRKLHEKIGQNYPPDGEFWVHLMNATGADRSEAIKYADEIRKKYKEVMSFYREMQGGIASVSTMASQEDGTKDGAFAVSGPRPPATNGADMTEIQFEDIFIRFPKGDIDAAETAKELIEMQIKKLKKSIQE